MTSGDDELDERARSRIGTTLQKKWRIDRLLGLGGFAAVYAATHRAGKRVAVKVLHPELAFRKSVRERFVREAYAANAIDHPGVVSVLDDDVTEDGAPYLVMDLLEGESLEERRERFGGALPPAEVLVLADRVLEVLAAAHDKGVVHRDIKPENLFLARNGDVRVLDFGIARVQELVTGANVTETGVPMGTPAFMPPEQARGRWNEVDARSDIWAVGATLFTLLSGRYVHDGATAAEMLVAAMRTPAPPLSKVMPGVSDAVAEVVDHALAFEAQRRWSSVGEMREAVRRALVEVEGAPRAGTPLSPPRSRPVDERLSTPAHAPSPGRRPLTGDDTEPAKSAKIGAPPAAGADAASGQITVVPVEGAAREGSGAARSRRPLWIGAAVFAAAAGAAVVAWVARGPNGELERATGASAEVAHAVASPAPPPAIAPEDAAPMPSAAEPMLPTAGATVEVGSAAPEPSSAPPATPTARRAPRATAGPNIVSTKRK